MSLRFALRALIASCFAAAPLAVTTATAVTAVTAVAAVISPALAVTLPTGFTSERVGFGPFGSGRPVGFALLPDGRILMVERNTGHVRVNAVGATSSVIFHTLADVNFVGGEQGLLGVCVDSNWPARPYVYFHYNHTSGFVYVSMLEAQGDLTDPASSNLTLTNPFHLLADLPDVSELHQAGTVRFGPDDMLYVSLGDDGNACNSQTLATLAGKILRIDVSGMPQAGTGPPSKTDLVPAGNPHAGPGLNEQLVWAEGLRNPFRFTMDPVTGDLFLGDVGLISYEEVDHIPFASGGGQNFGWPQREGPIDPGLGLPCGAGGTFDEPIFSYGRSEGFTVIVGPRYRDAGPTAKHRFPPEYDGSLFFMDFYLGTWWRLIEGSSGWEIAPPVAGQADLDHWATGFSLVSDIQQGPDGAIYYCNLIPPALDQGVFRIVPSGPVDAPVVAAPAASVTVTPNPAGPREATEFAWTAARAGEHRLRVYDLKGRLVHAEAATVGTGPARLRWSGRDDAGQPVPAGVYFYSLERPGQSALSGKVHRVR